VLPGTICAGFLGQGKIKMDKRFLILLLFYSLWPSLAAQEVVFSFPPLQSNERLAYRMGDSRGWILELYAQDIQSLYVTRLINTWDNSTEWGSLQFVNNRRDCFFVIETKGTSRIWSIYRLKGDEGVVVRLFDDRWPDPFTASVDGKFMLFDGLNDGIRHRELELGREGIFSLFDGETGVLLHRFGWTINNPIWGFFTVLRNADGTFRVLYTTEGSFVYGEARINPVTMKLEVLWDKTDDREFRGIKRTETQFTDDISYHYRDKTLNLETVVFAPGHDLSNTAIARPTQDNFIDESEVIENPTVTEDPANLAVITEGQSEPVIIKQGYKGKPPILWLVAGGGALLFAVGVAMIVITRRKKR